ncbi:Aste57867_14244 [Aphanomyces stellatus]|uniref:Aste57867_14244 protein n=1 Tax=Aphanomyces stellatus TaxID=120398 RepID=A0A485L084_9STRA|nr:hypothetical protein As57867_014193 [Aphanomyces stellatus]VFT91069.1 Aste57867_14244 [Aphanomyces stellatus]
MLGPSSATTSLVTLQSTRDAALHFNLLSLPHEAPYLNMTWTLHTPWHFFALLNAITMLQFLLAGVIPAAPNEFQVFIQQSLHVSSTDSAFYFGVLETALLAIYCLATLVVGHLSQTVRPFSLILAGLVLWVVSAAASGVARPAGSFYLLLLGRMGTGVAEATFRVLALPLIDRFTPPSMRSLWMGMYYAGISLASGVAYVFGAHTARTLGWDWSFYLCAMAMLPFLVVTYACIPSTCDVNRPLQVEKSKTESRSTRDLAVVLTSPVFLLSVAGISAINFTLQAMLTFAPSMLIGLDVFSDEWSAMAFGGLVMVAGIVGPPLGGALLDRATSFDASDSTRCVAACYQRLFFVAGSTLAGAVSLALLLAHVSPIVFLVAGFGFFGGMFATFGSTSTSLLLSVPPHLRGLAMGVGLLLQNALGNVPGPIVLGALKSWLAPGCGSDVVDGRDRVSLACGNAANTHGLYVLWGIMVLWMAWALVAWPLAYVAAKRVAKQDESMLDHMTLLETSYIQVGVETH